LLACLIVAPQRGYDEPGILSYAISSFCPTSADGLQADHIRALFRFKHGVRIGQPGIWWLKVSTANCFNEGGRITRLPFEERVQWVDENLERIRLIADNPRLGLKYLKPTNEGKLWLEEAADPFQFIAPARELVAAIDAGPDFVTTLPLPLDASNSGAQHYAMLARDPDGAKLTNLTFDGEIRCLYTEANKIKQQPRGDDRGRLQGREAARELLAQSERDWPQANETVDRALPLRPARAEGAKSPIRRASRRKPNC
jgi:DNA-directed RNA polymerase